MQVDVSFDFARVYDVNRIDVEKGQKFSLKTDFIGTSKWFSDNDPVLDLKVTGNNADVEATEVGTSVILIMDEHKNVQKELTISVVDEVLPLATSLGLTADAPVLK